MGTNRRRVLEDLIAEHGKGMPGYLGSTRYEVVDQPDMLVELADWESVELRDQHMTAAMESGVFAPLTDLMGAPFRVTVIRGERVVALDLVPVEFQDEEWGIQDGPNVSAQQRELRRRWLSGL